ncbi:MAG: PAS domain-containing protein [Anaerolineae bacterium]|nr:PAS domain-containing protein [Anaerolineae bacterium]
MVGQVSKKLSEKERLKLLESVIVHARDGVMITEAEPLDKPGPRIIYVNEAFCRMSGYAATEVLGLSPRLLQGEQTDRQTLDKLRQALTAREPVRVELINYRKDGTPFWVELNISPVLADDGQLTHFIAIQRDFTQLKLAETQYKQQLRYTQALTRCSQTLLASAGTTAKKQTILQQALYHLMEATKASRAYLFKNFHDPQAGFCFGIVAEATAPGIAPNLSQPAYQKIPWSVVPAENRRILEAGQPLGGATTSLFGSAPEVLVWLQSQSILSVQFFPIHFGQMWWGYIGFDDCTAPREWSVAEVQLLGTAAEMIDNVLQRWQAEEALWAAHNRLEVLHQVSHDIIAANLDRERIYREVHSAVGRLMPAKVFFIELINEDKMTAELVYFVDRGGRWPIRHFELAGSFIDYMLRRGRSLRIDDFSQFPPEEYQFGVVGDPEDTQSGVTVLLPGRERMVGIMCAQSYKLAAYSDSDLEMLELLAAHAAISLENVQLYQQAGRVAVDEERQRLARDLHDAVTQTLFSASLIAEALPEAWQQNPAKGQVGLTELRQLTRSALAEMRTLLLELRPAALTEKPLAYSLQHLSEAMLRRFKIPFDLSVEGDSMLPPDLQITIYRITQETLNNIVKHAAANQVQIRLICQPERIELTISDDGRGFNPTVALSHNLGLGIMRERAEAIGARLTLNSRPGQGTQVALVWQQAEALLRAFVCDFGRPTLL